MTDVYESATDGTGLWAAVFERDDDTAYFYLLDLTQAESGKIVEAFNAEELTAMPAATPISIRWDTSGDFVGLFATGSLVAIFDIRSDGKKGRRANNDDRKLFVLN
jgi:Uncharacterized protein conserved in bacteria